MDKSALITLQERFDGLSQTVPGEDIEFWYAWDLMEPQCYVRRENFQTAINRAIESCETTDYAPEDHFRGFTKMIETGNESADYSDGADCIRVEFEAVKWRSHETKH
jgi:DNA-damage-inducible protein D